MIRDLSKQPRRLIMREIIRRKRQQKARRTFLIELAGKIGGKNVYISLAETAQFIRDEIEFGNCSRIPFPFTRASRSFPVVEDCLWNWKRAT